MRRLTGFETWPRWVVGFLLASVVWVAAAAGRPAVFHPFVLGEIDVAVSNTIAEGLIPGGVFWLERNGHRYEKAYGNRALVPARETITSDTIFDAASLTKVVATTPAVLLLIERGLACVLQIPPNGEFRIEEFEEAEAVAKASMVGLWGACEDVTCD